MRMKKIISTVLVMFIFGCENKYAYHPSEKGKLANTVIKKTAIEIEHELGLIPFGTGGQMMDQIKMLHLGFQCHKCLTIETGRELLIASVEKFASKVNADETIRPYLNNYPFGPKNIEIVIYIQREDGSHFSSEDLCVVSAKNGNLEYLRDDPNGPLFETVYLETYEEALKKLQR